jgi:hypothetical protein
MSRAFFRKKPLIVATGASPWTKRILYFFRVLEGRLNEKQLFSIHNPHSAIKKRRAYRWGGRQALPFWPDRLGENRSGAYVEDHIYLHAQKACLLCKFFPTRTATRPNFENKQRSHGSPIVFRGTTYTTFREETLPLMMIIRHKCLQNSKKTLLLSKNPPNES